MFLPLLGLVLATVFAVWLTDKIMAVVRWSARARTATKVVPRRSRAR